MSKIPFHLITGFLGSGKTTFLKTVLEQFADKKRIAVIQNEFAETGIDGKELQAGGWRFDLMEVNKGSVFCVCMFSDFRGQLKIFVEAYKPDIVLLEATGLADPIAIGELLMEEALQQLLYLSKIWTVIDAQHYDKVKMLPAVKNQMVIAENIIVNKIDLISDEKKAILEDELKNTNPLANFVFTTYCRLKMDDLLSEKSLVINGQPVGPIKGIRTQVYRTPYAIKRKNLDYLVSSLNEEVYRLKGYFILDNNEAVMIQSVFGQTTLTPVDKTMLTTEIISIGKINIDFEFLLRKLVILK
ncbi:MAG: GTP-binding protein [Bacteroidales bacterium]|nr:GTP-binding protein [Bacteroidales bacterium]